MLHKQSSLAKNSRSSLSARAVARDAWGLVKESRPLWWLGVLAGLGQGYGMNSQLSYRLDSGDLQTIEQTVQRFSPGLAFVMLILVLLLLGVWVLSVMAEAGLMHGILARKEGQSVSFRTALASGRPALWPLIKLNIVVAVFSFLFIFAVGLPAAIAVTASTGGLVTGSAGVVLILAYGILLALLYPWMTRYVVLGKKSTREAIRSAWRLFRVNAGLVFRLGIGGLLLQVLGAVLIGIGVVILFIPLFVAGILIFRSNPEVALWPVLLGVVSVALILAGVLTALKNAYYTLAFDRLQQA